MSDKFRFPVEKLPTYPSPNSTLTFASHLGQNVGFRGGVGGQFPRNLNLSEMFRNFVGWNKMGMGDKSHEGLTLQLVDLTVIFSPPTRLIKTLLRAFLHSLSLITYFCKSPCNRTQPSCWMLHVASVCTQCCMLLRFVVICCAKFETGQMFSYMQTDEITLNTVGQQFWELLRPFA